MNAKGTPRRIARRALVSVSPLALAAGLLAFAATPAAASCTLTGTLSTWFLGASGNWNTAGNWSPSGVPNSSTTNVCIVDGLSTVTLDTSPSVASLQIASGNGLDISSGQRLNIFGPSLVNAGAIQITAGSNNAQLSTNGPVSLTGGGTVTLSNSATNVAYIAQAVGGSPLTNVDNTIKGSGNIGSNTGLAFVNQGTVDANVSGQTLILTGSGVANSNLLEATNNGTLAITTNVNNTGGAITANGGTVAISNSATITGGTLNSSGGGLLESVGGGETLNGVTIRPAAPTRWAAAARQNSSARSSTPARSRSPRDPTTRSCRPTGR
jgi:hypothetical protein